MHFGSKSFMWSIGRTNLCLANAHGWVHSDYTNSHTFMLSWNDSRSKTLSCVTSFQRDVHQFQVFMWVLELGPKPSAHNLLSLPFLPPPSPPLPPPPPLLLSLGARGLKPTLLFDSHVLTTGHWTWSLTTMTIMTTRPQNLTPELGEN